MNRIILKKNEERRIREGHLWIFSNEIQSKEGNPENGDILPAYDSKGNFLAQGFYNANSLIAFRVLSGKEEINLPDLVEGKILSAYNYRKSVYPERNSFRLVFSESDFLPGLIIDKYNDTFVLQVYSIGMEKNIDVIINVLKEKLGAKNIFSKHDEYFRKLEGLPEENSLYDGEMLDEIISDGKVKYKINFQKGQKTGFFFDQVDNRAFFGKFCKHKNVLDCFCNSGGFGLHAYANGAEKVTFVDSSKEEIENVKKNIALNCFPDKSAYFGEDVFDFLNNCINQKITFDIVSIDPPAFAKNKKALPKAIKGYEKLNKLAMEVVTPGGLLFSSSCSHHLKQDMFIELIKGSAVKAKKNVQQIYFNTASLDHPALPAMDETVYLKFVALRIT